MRRLAILISVSAAIAVLLFILGPRVGIAGASTAPAASRSFEFSYTVHVPALAAPSGRLRIWIPLPQTAAHQRISNLRVTSPLSYQIGRTLQYGDRFAYLQVDAKSARRTPFDIRITFDATRAEYRTKLPASDPPAPGSFPPQIAHYLLPNRLIPTDGMIGELSREETAGISDPLARARQIYEYVIAHMHYDHNGTGWGHGDAIFACTAHHGNCTDFHSLFIGMARAAGIPARFDIGFAIPPDKHEGKISSYHCWAEFYIQGAGWVPIDAAQAWQNPPRHNYYFGALDADRVRFTRGRDLRLSPPQAGGPVNYIVYPYAELNGKAFSGLTGEFSFRDLGARAGAD